MRTLSTKRTLFTLNSPLANPKPDRRKKDSWWAKPEFEPGLFLLYSREESSGAATPRTFWINELQRVNSEGATYYGHVQENADSQRYDALMEAMEEVEPDKHNLRHTLALHPDIRPGNVCEVLAFMLRVGSVTPDQLHCAFEGVLWQWAAEADAEEKNNG